MTSVRRLGLLPSVIGLSAIAAAVLYLGQTEASAKSECQGLSNHAELKAALVSAQGETNGGFVFEMWATIVARDGVVCDVAFTGGDRGD